MEAKIIMASSEAIILTGTVAGRPWRGEYRRIAGSLCYLLAKDDNLEMAALPHGTACVLPSLLGRAVLVRSLETANDAVIMTHEQGHVLAHKHGLTSADYAENEAIADRIGSRLQG